MLALTFIQPWASSVLLHGKNIENRPWAPTKAVLGTRIAIHAGKKVDKDDAWELLKDLPDLGNVPRGAILGTAEVAGWVRFENSLSGPHLGITDFVGLTEFQVAAVRASMWLHPSTPCAWVLRAPRVLAEPIPCAGALGLWRLPADVEARLNAQLAAPEASTCP